VTAGRISSCLLSWMIAVATAAAMQQDSVPPKKPDAFFAGSVAESSAERIVISRTVSGRTEKRTFKVTPETKVEGKLRAKVRVTVRYTAGDDNEDDVATLIVVRTAQSKK
jgi:hypothetical protein